MVCSKQYFIQGYCSSPFTYFLFNTIVAHLHNGCFLPVKTKHWRQLLSLNYFAIQKTDLTIIKMSKWTREGCLYAPQNSIWLRFRRLWCDKTIIWCIASFFHCGWESLGTHNPIRCDHSIPKRFFIYIFIFLIKWNNKRNKRNFCFPTLNLYLLNFSNYKVLYKIITNYPINCIKTIVCYTYKQRVNNKEEQRTNKQRVFSSS